MPGAVWTSLPFMAGISRRQVLVAGLALGLGAAIGQSRTAQAAQSKWRDLSRRLPGRLVEPGDPRYEALATPRNLRYAALMPAAVALCRSTDDIAAAVAWARRTQTPFAIRGGGHNYMDASSSQGLIISTRPMTATSLDGTTLRAQAGVRNSDLARILPQEGNGTLLLPGGTCPNVGIAGLTLGGGIGPNAPWAGLTADRLREATMVTASGDVVTASASRNPALFWALRGAAGGNFGVVTELTYELVTIPVTTATTFQIEYPIDVATETAMAWQQVRQGHEQVVGGVWSMLMSSTGPRARIRAQVLLAESDARSFMAPLLAQPITKQEIVERTWWDAYAWYRTPISPPSSFWDPSLFAERDLDAGVIDQLTAQLLRFPSPQTGFGSFGICGWIGGRVRDVAPEHTAYVHRNATSLLEFGSGWPTGEQAPDWPTPVPPAIRDWMIDLFQIAYPSSSGESYQNFPDPGLADPLVAYYGANLARLSRVKARWDPDDVFTYSQGIPPRTVDQAA